MQIDLSQCIKCQFVYLIVYYDVYYVVTIMYIYADDHNELNYKSVPNLHCMQTPPVLIFIAMPAHRSMEQNSRKSNHT